jgi:hypothetical protein
MSQRDLMAIGFRLRADGSLLAHSGLHEVRLKPTSEHRYDALVVDVLKSAIEITREAKP